MPKLTIKNLERVIDSVSETDNLLDVLRREDIYVKSSCGGHASCTDCVIKIVSGEDNLSPPPFEEINLLGNVFHITKERLACQTKITDDVTIDLSNHVQSADEEKLRNKTSKSQVRVRKSEDVSKMYEERKQKVDEKKKERDERDESYFKHWEKDKNSEEGIPRRKKLDGGRRPRPFKTPEKEDTKEENED